jgi:hypothetical protein
MLLLDADGCRSLGILANLHGLVTSVSIIVSATLVSISCATRMALPSPFPLTYGGTTIPAKGVAGGLEIGDGLSGQEVQRAEIVSLNLGVGVADRISVSGGVYEVNEFNILSGGPSGSVWRVKARLGDLFGPRSSVSANVAVASVDREDLPAQNESLRTLDIAAPVEFLLTDPAKRWKGSAYVGPRVTKSLTAIISTRGRARTTMLLMVVG